MTAVSRGALGGTQGPYIWEIALLEVGDLLVCKLQSFERCSSAWFDLLDLHDEYCYGSDMLEGMRVSLPKLFLEGRAERSLQRSGGKGSRSHLCE